MDCIFGVGVGRRDVQRRPPVACRLGAALSGALGTAFGVRAPVITGGVILLVSLALVPRLSVVAAAANAAAAVHEKPQTTS